MNFRVLQGDAIEVLRTLPEASVHCAVTSPPYFNQRDYGVPGQLGLESDPRDYVGKLVEILREVRRVLVKTGSLFLNLGDSYAGSWGAQGRQGKTGELAGRSACAARQIAAAARKEHNTGSIPKGSGLKPKDLIGIPWAVAFALRMDGWWLRQDIPWVKGNGMPESVKDRCTRAHEYIFHLTKAGKYYYDWLAISEPCAEDTAARYNRGRSEDHKWADGGPGGQTIARTFDAMKQNGHGRRHAGFNDREFSGEPRERRNKRSWWLSNTQPTPEAHFATMPLAIAETCVLAGCPEGGIVLDPFAGAGTTGLACLKNGRNFIGIELNPKYIEIAHSRARKYYPLLVSPEETA